MQCRIQTCIDDIKKKCGFSKILVRNYSMLDLSCSHVGEGEGAILYRGAKPSKKQFPCVILNVVLDC